MRCGTKSLLLVLDNCEHVIDAAAALAEALLHANSSGAHPRDKPRAAESGG